MPIPLVDLRAQYLSIQPEIDAAIARVLTSCAFAGGPEVEAFEKAFAAYCGMPHCVGVSSGTAALELLLRAYGIGAGDDVIVPANTFFATAEAVSLVGARPVFVDVDPATALIDPRAVASAITPKTKAIVPVHLYGQVTPMDQIMSLVEKHSLTVIEDCCQAHGARLHGAMAGTFGHAAAFSFYPGKNLGAYGEAGAVVTRDAARAEDLKLLRDHGSKTKYEHAVVGRNDRMDGLQAAIVAAKLPHLDSWNARRRTLSDLYRRLLDGHPRIRCIEQLPGARSACHLFVVRVPKRDDVRAEMNRKGIGVGIHYPVPLHLQPVYASLGYKKGSLPHAELLAQEVLSLPLYPEMTEAQVEETVAVLKTVV